MTNSLLRASTSNMITLRTRISIYEFERDTKRPDHSSNLNIELHTALGAWITLIAVEHPQTSADRRQIYILWLTFHHINSVKMVRGNKINTSLTQKNFSSNPLIMWGVNASTVHLADSCASSSEFALKLPDCVTLPRGTVRAAIRVKAWVPAAGTR